jgi:hypothetical protein
MTADDDLDLLDKRYKINHRALALDLVRARKARRPTWATMLRGGYWSVGLRGWEGKPRWGVYRFYYDGDWWVTFHAGLAWAEWRTTEEEDA